MNRIIRTIILASALLASSTSCVKQKLEDTYTKQEDRIDAYIKSKMNSNPEATLTRNGGANRLTLVHGSGEELSAEGTVAFYYAGYIFSGSLSPTNLFSTNHQATAEEASWNLTDGKYNILTINLKEDDLIQGLKDGLKGVKAGDECEILFTGKFGFGKDQLGIIPENSPLAYKVWVESVSND